MSNPQELFVDLSKDPVFKTWIKNNPEAFLSHFFAPIDSLLQPKEEWEIGFYEPLTDLITVFKPLVKSGFEIRPAAEIFKAPDSSVETLEMDDVQCSFDDACTVARVQFAELFPSEKCGDGFVILQSTDQLALWNFTLISQSLKFLNVKINASTSKLASHQVIELVQK